MSGILFIVVVVIAGNGAKEVDACWQYCDNCALWIKLLSVAVTQHEVPVRESRRRVWEYAREISEDGLQHL